MADVSRDSLATCFRFSGTFSDESVENLLLCFEDERALKIALHFVKIQGGA